MPEETDLERRIRELEAENSRLKSNNPRVGEYTAREDIYEGHPIIVFERPNGRSFRLGLAKLRAIRACWHKVEEFLHRHGSTPPGGRSASGESNDDRI